MTIYEELKTYWQQNNLPDDGGVTDSFNVAKVGIFSFKYPNLDGNALLLHDLNHLITGYKTNWQGECEVSAWELASGGRKGYSRTWIYPISLVLLGMIICPIKTIKAYREGKVRTNSFILSLQNRNLLELTKSEVLNLSNKKFKI